MSQASSLNNPKPQRATRRAPPAPLRTKRTPCLFFPLGTCKYGGRCAFQHVLLPSPTITSPASTAPYTPMTPHFLSSPFSPPPPPEIYIVGEGFPCPEGWSEMIRYPENLVMTEYSSSLPSARVHEFDDKKVGVISGCVKLGIKRATESPLEDHEPSSLMPSLPSPFSSYSPFTSSHPPSPSPSSMDWEYRSHTPERCHEPEPLGSSCNSSSLGSTEPAYARYHHIHPAESLWPEECSSARSITPPPRPQSQPSSPRHSQRRRTSSFGVASTNDRRDVSPSLRFCTI